MMKEEDIIDLFRQHQAGRFEIKKILGIGGMGIVVQAFDTKLKVLRAIKIFNPELLAQESLVRRFKNEAAIMAGIEHPNIVKVYDIGEINDHHFIVLEWIDGGSLASFLDERGAMHPRVALEMIYRVSDALSVAHRRGIIHRDIKPDNILITKDGVPKVADFGIAHMDGDNSPLTGVGEGLATPRIGAPEQFANAVSVDARADVYATAVTFWMLMTAKRPPGLLFLHDIEEDATLLANIPLCIHAILKKAVAYYPSGRYATMEAFAQALCEVEDRFPPLGGHVIMTVPVSDDIGVMDDTAVGVTRFASLIKPKVVVDPTRVSKPVHVVDEPRNTLAYRPSGEVARADSLPIDSASDPVADVNGNGGEGLAPPLRNVSESTTAHPMNLRTYLIALPVFLCMIGIGALLWVSTRTQTTVAEQPVLQSVANVGEGQAPPLWTVTEPDTIIVQNTSLTDIDATSEPPRLPAGADIQTVIVQIPIDVPTEKQPKDRKIGKPSRSIVVKAGETLVLKPEPKQTSPLPPPLQGGGVQVGLKIPSDDTVRVWLVGPNGRHKLPGSVTPGSYKVVAIFKDQDAETVVLSKFEVIEGASLRLSCDSQREVCQKL